MVRPGTFVKTDSVSLPQLEVAGMKEAKRGEAGARRVRYARVRGLSIMLVAAMLTGVLTGARAEQLKADSVLEARMQAFWAATTPAEIRAATRQVLASGAGYDDLASRLKAGRRYAKARTGRVPFLSQALGASLDNVVEIPANYDPARAWPLRVSLHGGVGREAPAADGPPPRPLTNRTPIDGEIVLHPRAWAGSEWWTAPQVENITRLVARVKREYNIDEARTYITGISDGGTGVYFFAMRAAGPWAACMPLNGHPLVLANPDTAVDGELFSSNLVNCPMHAVNGGRDPLYPADSVAPFIEMFKRGGVPVDFQVYPNAGHDVSWWPEERPIYEKFLAAHARVAHPERISWEVERADRYNRFRWLVITELGVRASDRTLPDVNRFEAGGRTRTLFARPKPSGRVDAWRHGNRFDVETRGVRGFTLLLSPDVVDFAKPVNVTVNGRVVHDARVEKSSAALLAWAAQDDDRTMLYAAELKIEVP